MTLEEDITHLLCALPHTRNPYTVSPGLDKLNLESIKLITELNLIKTLLSLEGPQLVPNIWDFKDHNSLLGVMSEAGGS